MDVEYEWDFTSDLMLKNDSAMIYPPAIQFSS